MATEFTILAAFVVTIIGQLAWLAWHRRHAGAGHPNWTARDRRQVRVFRTLNAAGVAAAWCILVANLARHPGLLHDSRLLSVAAMPLLLSSLVLTLAYIAPRRSEGDFRPFMVTGLIICAGIVGTSLTLTALTWG